MQADHAGSLGSGSGNVVALAQWEGPGVLLSDAVRAGRWVLSRSSRIAETTLVGRPFLNPHVSGFIQMHRRPNWIKHSFSSQWTANDRLVSLTARDFLTELANVTDRDWH